MYLFRVFLVRGITRNVSQCIYSVRYGGGFGYHGSEPVSGVFVVPHGIGLGLHNSSNTAEILLASRRSSLSQPSI